MKKILIYLATTLLVITGFAQQTNNLSSDEKNAILYMREEEKLARDVYDSLYVKWDVNPFNNIRKSEQVHMDEMKLLITTYNLQDPVEANNNKHGVFTNILLQKYYSELVTTGSLSLIEALKAGAKIEELDISDLDIRIAQTNNKDIIASYNYLKMASKNHLRAFVRNLKMQGINYEPIILSKAAFKAIIKAETNGGGCCKGQN
ncbi:MAG: DUF2202 domain-containing protein [Chitinophagaceae bacterium]|nr:DUF2202 domain-containing protein [Chitinophagaceae bacterium]